MKGWSKIQSFSRIYQAELCKDILDKNNISSAIINAKDSLFLMGEIELYVKNENEAHAKALIDEFNGLIKINSFVGYKQIELFNNILLDNDIEAFIVETKNSKYILENYEQYIKNEDIEKIVPFLTGEKLLGWKKIETCTRVNQTKYRTDILDERNINSIVIKRKNSEFHLEEIDIYVEEQNSEKAITLFDELYGWIKIASYNESYRGDITVELLNDNNIKALQKRHAAFYEIYVEYNTKEAAIDIVNRNKEWLMLHVFDSLYKAEFYKDLLKNNSISSIIVNEKDSMFLIGEIEMYVEKSNLEKAKSLIK